MFGLFKRNHVSKKIITKAISDFNDMINSKLNDIWMIDKKIATKCYYTNISHPKQKSDLLSHGKAKMTKMKVL